MSLTLLGEGKARVRGGEWLPATEALRQAGLEPIHAGIDQANQRLDHAQADPGEAAGQAVNLQHRCWAKEKRGYAAANGCRRRKRYVRRGWSRLPWRRKKVWRC
jgi:hypothetical protein